MTAEDVSSRSRVPPGEGRVAVGLQKLPSRINPPCPECAVEPASLPPRNKSIEPRSGGKKRMQEMQHELDVRTRVSELRELVNRIEGQVT